VIRYAWRTLAAHVRRGPVLHLLTVLGVALGVASVVCIQIINRNAISAFEAGIEALGGEAQLSVLGRTPTFPEALFPQILAEAGVAAAWPLYRVDAALGAREPEFLDVVGVDLFAARRWPWQGEPRDLGAALGEAGWVAVSPRLASRHGYVVGDPVVVTSGSRRVELRIGALVDFRRRNPQASDRLAVMDIAQAQSLFGRPGELSQVDVRVVEGADPAAVAARLADRLGPSVRVLTPEQRSAQATDLLGAFRLNLTALSLVSLFVGLALIHEATQAALVRRRREFGVLRALGATRAQVLGLILGEVSLLGLAGVGLGLGLGYWAARANVDVVSATLTSLYLLEAIESIEVPAWIVALAVLIGMGGALAGGLGPALDVGRRETRALLATFTLRARLRAAAYPAFVAGVTVLALGGLTFWWLSRSWRPAGWGLAIALLVAIPLVAPLAVEQACSRVRIQGFGLGYGVRSLGTRLQTTAFAVASLAIAVSLLIGITLMIGSFRRTVEVWVASTVRADAYVSTPTWARQGLEAALDDALVSALAAHPGVAYVDRLRKLHVRTGERRIAVAGIDMSLPGRDRRLALLAGDPAEVFRRVREEGAVLVSEPLAVKAGLGAGDRVRLPGPRGEAAFPVAGVYYDYSTEGGAVVMDLGTLARHFGPGPVQSLALYLEPGREADRVVDELRTRFRDRPLVIRENRRLREEIFAIFDQTFAVTRILQVMSLVTAVSGITLGLVVLARERAAELALCRSLGATRPQLFRVFVGQGLGMGVLALALGLLGGVALAAILVFVINRAYFGWTIQLAWPWAAVGRQVAIILGAALLASLYPAVVASRVPAADLSREE
jgi:putative ABC transport system permease protein